MQEEILSVINQWNEKSLAALYRNFYKVTVSYAYKIVKEQMIDVLTNYATIRILSIESKKCFI